MLVEEINIVEFENSLFFSCGGLLFKTLPAYALSGLASQEILFNKKPAIWLNYRGKVAFFEYHTQESVVLIAAQFPQCSGLGFVGQQGDGAGWLARRLIRVYVDRCIVKSSRIKQVFSKLICWILWVSIGEHETFKIAFP